jgi:predicted RNA-binding protein with PIN domain
MHYFVDGYNLLFRLLSNPSDTLKESRDQLIDTLAEQIDLLEMDVTLVFDATYTVADLSKSHRRYLEIVYTAHGETADEYILSELRSLDSRNQVVVTGDNRLAWQARRLHAHTESVTHFLETVKKRYKNRLRTGSKLLKKLKKPKPIIQPTEDPRLIEDQDKVYQQIFEERHQQLESVEEVSKEQKRAARKNPPKKKAPPKKNGTMPIQSDFQRWLDLFSQ